VHVHAPPGQPLRAVRVFSYLPGLPLPEAQPSAVQISALGTMLARLGLALRDFHPALGSGNEEKLPWDLQHAGDLRALTVHLPDATQRSLAERQLRRFDEQTVPAMQAFRRQAIHNDLNIHNVLVAPDDHARISGILDFGDMVCAPLINDVAVAASYQLGNCPEEASGNDAGHPCVPDAGRVEAGHPITGNALWANVFAFVAAYHAVSPLKAEEIDVLFDLIVTRLVMVVTTGGWRAARHPENAAYILRNNAVSWRRLIACSAVSRDEVTAALHAACA
jgi:Ser/Thr protein kinase RdoA (MazF antagonist)